MNKILIILAILLNIGWIIKNFKINMIKDLNEKIMMLIDIYKDKAGIEVDFGEDNAYRLVHDDNGNCTGEVEIGVYKYGYFVPSDKERFRIDKGAWEAFEADISSSVSVDADEEPNVDILEGEYKNANGTSDTISYGYDGDTIRYRVKSREVSFNGTTFPAQLVQQQMTTYPTPNTRVRTAQGFFAGNSTYGSYYRESKINNLAERVAALKEKCLISDDLLTPKKLGEEQTSIEPSDWYNQVDNTIPTEGSNTFKKSIGVWEGNLSLYSSNGLCNFGSDKPWDYREYYGIIKIGYDGTTYKQRNIFFRPPLDLKKYMDDNYVVTFERLQDSGYNVSD